MRSWKNIAAKNAHLMDRCQYKKSVAHINVFEHPEAQRSTSWANLSRYLNVAIPQNRPSPTWTLNCQYLLTVWSNYFKIPYGWLGEVFWPHVRGHWSDILQSEHVSGTFLAILCNFWPYLPYVVCLDNMMSCQRSCGFEWIPQASNASIDNPFR